MKKQLLAAACLLSLGGMAYAQDTATFTIGGTLTTTACTPVIASGGVFAYGAMSDNLLSQNATTTLAKKDLSLTVTCTPGTAKVGLTVTDSKAASRIATTLTGPAIGATTAQTAFGLGVYGTKNIGGYVMTIDNLKIGGTAAQGLLSTNSAASYVNKGTNAVALEPVAANRVAFTTSSGDTTAMAGGSFTGDLHIQATIDKLSTLGPLSSAVTLDGSATLQVIYL